MGTWGILGIQAKVPARRTESVIYFLTIIYFTVQSLQMPANRFSPEKVSIHLKL